MGLIRGLREMAVADPGGHGPKESLVEKTTSQTVLRALGLLEAVADGIYSLEDLSAAAGLTRSTTHRLLSTLTRAGYLRHEPRAGYLLGPRLIELGFKAHGQLHLPSLARPHLARLAQVSQETVHLGVLDGADVVYLDKVQGTRGLQMASCIGGRAPAQATALGKAILSALPETEWLAHLIPNLQRTPNTVTDPQRFQEELARVAARGYALDLEENEPGIRCIAAPIRDGGGRAVAAVSISSAVIYLTDERMAELIPCVVETAQRISRDLGWSPDQRRRRPETPTLGNEKRGSSTRADLAAHQQGGAHGAL